MGNMLSPEMSKIAAVQCAMNDPEVLRVLQNSLPNEEVAENVCKLIIKGRHEDISNLAQ